MGVPMITPRRWTIIGRAIRGNQLYNDSTGKNPSMDDDLAEDTISSNFIPFTSPATLHAPVQIAATGGSEVPVPPSAPLTEAAAATPTTPPSAESEPSIQIGPVAIVSAVLGFFAVVCALAVMIITRTSWYRQKKSGTGSRPSKTGKRTPKRKDPRTRRSSIFKISNEEEVNEKSGSLQSITDDRGSAVPTLYYYAIGTDAGDEDIADTLKYESTVGSMVSITYEAGLSRCVEDLQDGHEAAASEETHSSAETGATHSSVDLYSITSTRTSMTSIMSSVDLEEEAEEEMGQVQRAQTQSMEIKRAVLVNLSALIT